MKYFTMGILVISQERVSYSCMTPGSTKKNAPELNLSKCASSSLPLPTSPQIASILLYSFISLMLKYFLGYTQ